MKMSLTSPAGSLSSPLGQAVLLTSVLLFCFAPSNSHANVYATHIQLNGGTTNVNYSPGNPLTIGYILNDTATAGVSINIGVGSNVVRTLVFTNGGPGTARGTNLVTWDGKDGQGNNPPGGAYSVAITAASTGYDDWTQISVDANPGNYVWEPRGIAVNRNSSSPYYGRVFVGNSTAGPNPSTVTGDAVGLQKLNADGSPADEGIFSTGGWGWAGDTYSPWKIEVSTDDYVYVNDWTGNGIVLRWDQTLSSNSIAMVLRSDNWPNSGAANMSGPAISGSGTNTQVWMADINYNVPSVGIRAWTVAANGLLATNDLGATAVAVTPSSDLSLYPWDVALDSNNYIYTIQYRSNSGDPAYRVMRFLPWTNGAPAETTADWKIGSADDSMRNAFGIAVSPDGTYVAVAFLGVGSFPNFVGGAVRVFMATNGADVVTLAPNTHDQTDVAWDNVGNVYAVDNVDSVWRAYSPPGTNFATTVATASVFVSGPPVLSGPAYTNGVFQFTLNGIANTSYVILTSSNLATWAPITTNVAPSAIRTISLPAPLNRSFYKAMVGP